VATPRGRARDRTRSGSAVHERPDRLVAVQHDSQPPNWHRAELRGVADQRALAPGARCPVGAAVGVGEHGELDRDPCRWSSIPTAMRYFLPRSR